MAATPSGEYVVNQTQKGVPNPDMPGRLTHNPWNGEAPDMSQGKLDPRGVLRIKGKVAPGHIPPELVAARDGKGFGGKDRPKCIAKTRNGERCKASPLSGTNLCRWHGGPSLAKRKGVKPERRRLRRMPFRKARQQSRETALKVVSTMPAELMRSRPYRLALAQGRTLRFRAALVAAFQAGQDGDAEQWFAMVRDIERQARRDELGLSGQTAAPWYERNRRRSGQAAGQAAGQAGQNK